MNIKAKYSGYCHLCAKRYAVGDIVEWVKGSKPIHHECALKRSVSNMAALKYDQPQVDHTSAQGKLLRKSI